MHFKLATTALDLSSAATALEKVIADNDWCGAYSWPVGLVLLAESEVLGFTSSLGDCYPTESGQHILRLLEVINRTDIDVYIGPTFPLINTVERSNAWQAAFGALAWNGAFNPDNATADALGSDAGANHPFQTSKIPEGVPTIKAQNMSAVNFMIEQVRKYPGEVVIYAAGAMTTVALAIRLDPFFAANCKKIVIQGGYIDTALKQTNPQSPTSLYSETDVWADFNFFVDPESAKIVVNAPFPEIVLAGTVGAEHFLTGSLFNETIASNFSAVTPYLAEFYAGDINTPLWDEIAAVLAIHPELTTGNRYIYADVDTSFGLFYGRTNGYVKPYQPANSVAANYITSIDFDAFSKLLVAGLTKSSY